MKNLQYIFLIALIGVLCSACVKKDWDDVDRPTFVTPDKYWATLDENFNNLALVDGQYLVVPQGWLNTGRQGMHRAFQTSVTANDALDSVQCATATAYLALGATDAWLITPPLKIVNGAAFTYTAALAYNTGSRATVEVRCFSTLSTNNQAPTLDNPNDWTLIATLSNTAPYNVTSGTGAVIWWHFYPQSHVLSSFKKNSADDVMYVAFRYVIPKVTSSNSWYFDDMKY